MLLFLLLTCLPLPALAAESAVGLIYHRFGEDRYPSTNTTLEQFDEHLRILGDGRTVVPLARVLDALDGGAELPETAVFLTIDDAHASVWNEAWPRLRAAGLPFALFVSTDAVDAGGAGSMTWEQIRALKAAGVTIGHHGAAHGHMATWDAETVRADLERASERFRAELGAVPEILAWPYGEAGPEALKAARELGFRAAFGQHSGVLHAGAPRFYLPRFALNESYGKPERVRLVTRALPLPVRLFEPSSPLLDGANPPKVRIVAERGLGRPTCYASGLGAVEFGEDGALVLAAPFPAGRARINCTLPGDQGRWHWFGHQYFVPR